MGQAIRNIRDKGARDKLVLAVFTYAHSNLLSEFFLHRKLKLVGLDAFDILLLGYYSRRPRQRLIDGALKWKEQGLIRHLGVSSHNRKLFPALAKENIFDVFHFRYNAVNRGASQDIFPHIPPENRPGMVSFTATAWT